MAPESRHILVDSDLKQIIEIAQGCLLGTSEEFSSGLLTKVPSIEELRRFDRAGSLQISHRDSRIVGYVTAFQALSNDPEMAATRAKFENINWHSELPPLERLVYCDQVAIHSNFRRRQVASGLLRSVFEAYQGSSFLVAILEGPVRNEASISLCLKHGFRRIGERIVPEYRGLKQFQSGWYLRSR